jgi:hypothetical protein
MSVPYKCNNRRPHPHVTALAGVEQCFRLRTKLSTAWRSHDADIGAEMRRTRFRRQSAQVSNQAQHATTKHDNTIRMACMIRTLAEISGMWLVSTLDKRRSFAAAAGNWCLRSSAAVSGSLPLHLGGPIQEDGFRMPLHCQVGKCWRRNMSRCTAIVACI